MRVRKSKEPIKTDARKARAHRRVGEGAVCACGESRPEALIPGTRPMRCEECSRIKVGRKLTDEHHVAGKANSPVMVALPANDHRAGVSIDQYEWQQRTLENADGSPVLRAAAALRGVVDTFIRLLEMLVESSAIFLEALDVWLRNALGEKWWVGTSLEGWVPR